MASYKQPIKKNEQRFTVRANPLIHSANELLNS